MSTGNQIVAIVGGAVAGSEAVHQLTERGIRCIVVEQNDLPYGKIEDGLPKWHAKQRKKEMELIDGRIGHELVDFLPNTQIGKDLAMEELLAMGCSAVLMANGAWKDRSFPVKEIERYEGDRFYYQNPFVYWYNHNEQSTYTGEQIEVRDNALVIGGGLASIDVVKILQVELVSKVLKNRGIEISTIDLEHKGIPSALDKLGLTWDDLHLEGAYLLYRRNVRNMPLASIPADATPEKEQRVRDTRAKILKKAQDKYLFRFKDQTQPVGIIEEGGRLVGLQMIENDVVNNKAVSKEGTEYDVFGSMVISLSEASPNRLKESPWSGVHTISKTKRPVKSKGFTTFLVWAMLLQGRGTYEFRVITPGKLLFTWPITVFLKKGWTWKQCAQKSDLCRKKQDTMVTIRHGWMRMLVNEE